MSTDELDDFLEGEAVNGGAEEPQDPTPEPEPQPAEGAEPPNAEAQPGEGQQPDATGANAEPPSAEEKSEGNTVPMAVLHDERGKRQALEAQNQQLLNLLSQNQQAQDGQQPGQKAPLSVDDLLTDPNRVFSDMQSQFEQQLTVQKMEMSETIARGRYDDYDATMQPFYELQHTAPDRLQAIYQAASQQPDPAGYIYGHMKQQALLNEIGNDPDAYRKKIEAEIRAKIVAEQGQNPQPAGEGQPPTPAPSIPETLAKAGNGGGMATPVFSGAPSLDDILKTG